MTHEEAEKVLESVRDAYIEGYRDALDILLEGARSINDWLRSESRRIAMANRDEADK